MTLKALWRTCLIAEIAHAVAQVHVLSAPLLRRWVSLRRPAPRRRPPLVCRRHAMPAGTPHTCAWRHARLSGALGTAALSCGEL